MGLRNVLRRIVEKLRGKPRRPPIVLTPEEKRLVAQRNERIRKHRESVHPEMAHSS